MQQKNTLIRLLNNRYLCTQSESTMIRLFLKTVVNDIDWAIRPKGSVKAFGGKS